MVWEPFTAIGTLLAVFVALFLPMWQNRRRLSVQVATPGGRNKIISVVMTNSGGKVMTIVRVLTKGQDGQIVEREIEELPLTLRPGDFINLTHPYIAENLGVINEILVEDSLGRRWKCEDKSIRTALGIRGEKRRLFPVSKDFDEWAEKNRKK